MMMDRINDLSDDIICHILSFLPIKQSALTSVLSKRWRNLFALTPNLHLDDNLEQVGCGQSFVDFVDRVLLAVSGNLPFRNVSIKYRKRIHSGHAIRWMIDLLKRATVVNLDVDAVFNEEGIFPLEIFTCKTMVELKLVRGFDAMLPGDVFLPSLKTLFLRSVYFYNTSYCVLEKLLSACPVLEELIILGDPCRLSHFSLTVSSSTLKKLTIFCFNHINFWGITFDTPNLAYLEYSDLVPRDYLFVNFESLVEAKLDLRLYNGINNPTNLLKGLRNIEVLELSSVTSKTVYHFREAVPVFSNLLRLSITIDSLGYSWEVLPVLARNSPNLHTLVIKGPLHAEKRRRAYGSSCPVKVLKIMEYGGNMEELEQMKRFLKKLPCTELVKIRAWAMNEEEKSRVTKDLLTVVPRSSKCKIQIKFS